MSGVRVDEEPRNARPSVIPSASEGPRLHSWITEANLRNQHRTARFLGPSRTGVVCAAREDR